ncbi:membrane protein insertase YidC [Cellulomonas sp. DKR-3]|uniref:Membrane protein insertase YidC n=1 Tax=Cellulomonas fulva TaxID=2835530 RepID=A0ABS5TWK5_9CELL|nr:membrane protein insertase YidC [Cellulomonas fulva]MBT0993493.1 membrane protein insertase YidC [Cellulomonas fulva]
MSWFDGLLQPIMIAVAWIMVQFHSLFSWLGMDPDGGLAWTLSIVGLVIVIRIALIPLFFKQIKASRGMQMLAPEMQAIQKKYKGKSDPASREAMSRETMELYRKHGTNPFASCLPILLQSPIFFALFRVLNSLKPLSEGTYPRGDHIGPMTQQLAESAEGATVLGAPLSGTFMQANGDIHIQIVTILLIVAMSATTFLTQRQLTMKNMPPAAKQGPMAQQQKVLLYVLPLIFAFSGVNFPIGVLIYWTTTNLWSMGQQFYTIRRMPAPGSDAEKAMLERRARKGKGGTTVIEAEAVVVEERPRGQREQPKRKDRAKTQRPAGTASGASSSASSDASLPVSDAPVSDAPVSDAPITDAPSSGAPAKKPTGASSKKKKPRPSQN